MALSTIRYDQPASSATTMDTNWLQEGAGYSQITVLSDGTGTGTAFGTSANPFYIQGYVTAVYNVTTPTLGDGDTVQLQANQNGYLLTDSPNVIDQIKQTNELLLLVLNELQEMNLRGS